LNINVHDDSTKATQVGLHQLGFKQYVRDPTTDAGTLIDHFFARNVDICSIEVIDCHFSFHDCIVGTVKALP